MRSLVIDDSRAMRRIVGTILTDFEYEVREAALMTRPPTVVDDEDVADALGELANVLGGNTKSLLPGVSRLGLPRVGAAPARGRPDDVRSLAGQWRGNFLTITVQGAIPAPHPSGTEVPQ